MPRNISFMLTTDQILARTKTVTRRLGWIRLKPGELLNGCRKCMGLKPGEKVERLALIRVTGVRREPLRAIVKQGPAECCAEGFPEMTPQQFVEFFCASHKGCAPDTVITRIAFEYM